MNKTWMPINLKSSIKWIKYQEKKYNLSQLIQEEAVLLTIKEIESVVKNLFIRRAIEPDDLKGKFYQIFKEPIISVYTNS